MAEDTVINLQDESSQPMAQALPAPVKSPRKRGLLIGIIVVAVLIIASLVFGLVMLLRADAATTSEIRDIFIIFMALESLVLGVALVILIIQLAMLINLLQNDIKPIIKSTNETVSTLRGTAAFLSNNVTEPVIKLNEYLAGIKKLLDILRPGRR